MSEASNSPEGLQETEDAEWLHRLLADWQLLADLSFADCALWQGSAGQWRAVAQVRPTTGISVFPDDLVGDRPSLEVGAAISQAHAASQRVTVGSVIVDGDECDIDVIPVVREGRVIAAITRHMRVGNIRRRGRLESTYLGVARQLLDMVARGTFPDGSGTGSARRGAPRVGDGVVAVDAQGRVTYASPNAVSALRRLHVNRNVLGERLGAALDDAGAVSESAEEASAVLAGRVPWQMEMRNGSSAVTIRSVPLRDATVRTGAVLLLRDVSELRRRDRELLTKDATIREVHHRVKNNLQTVSALLRLQARRLPDDDARQALTDAGRRVAVIAGVHETLSEGFGDAVDFDEIASRALAMGVEVARRTEAPVEARAVGTFGVLASEDATALALVMGELIQNAVEHGLGARGGEVVVQAERDGDSLVVEVSDNGVGLPDNNAASEARRTGLGTQIVRTFVQDLHGEIAWMPNADGGTRARFTAQLQKVDEPKK